MCKYVYINSYIAKLRTVKEPQGSISTRRNEIYVAALGSFCLPGCVRDAKNKILKKIAKLASHNFRIKQNGPVADLNVSKLFNFFHP